MNQEMLCKVISSIEKDITKVERKDDCYDGIYFSVCYCEITFTIRFHNFGWGNIIKFFKVNGENIYVENEDILDVFINQLVKITDERRVNKTSNYMKELFKNNETKIKEVESMCEIKNKEDHEKLTEHKSELQNALSKIDMMIKEYDSEKEDREEKQEKWEKKKKSIWKYIIGGS